MNNDETKQLIIDILNIARTAKSSESRFILNWKDYRACARMRRYYKLTVQALQRVSNRLFKKYLKGVSQGAGNFNQLLAYQQLQAALQFYNSEFGTYDDMICEYEAYLMEDGNLLSAALLGAERPYRDLRDFRE